MTPATHRPLPAGVTPGPYALPAPRPRHPQPPPALPPGEVIARLEAQLRRHGLARIYACASDHIAVLSLPGMTIWCHRRILTWTRHGQVTTWPASDLTGAAACLATLTGPAAPDQAGTP